MRHKRKPLLFVKLYILEAFAIYLFQNFKILPETFIIEIEFIYYSRYSHGNLLN